MLDKALDLMKYERGNEEDSFLKNLNVSSSEIEVLGKKGTETFVWHTKTEPPEFKNPRKLTKYEMKSTNLGKLCQSNLNICPIWN